MVAQHCEVSVVFGLLALLLFRPRLLAAELPRAKLRVALQDLLLMLLVDLLGLVEVLGLLILGLQLSEEGVELVQLAVLHLRAEDLAVSEEAMEVLDCVDVEDQVEELVEVVEGVRILMMLEEEGPEIGLY